MTYNVFGAMLNLAQSIHRFILTTVSCTNMWQRIIGRQWKQQSK